MASVTIRDVCKSFGGNMVIDHFSLGIDDGEFLVVVGPSGCGKTTLLRTIAGLEQPTSGEILIGDRPVVNLAPKDRDVAMVFQDYALYAHLTVYDNLAFGLRMRKVPRGEIDPKVRGVAKMIGIDALLQRKPRQLSGGERQRVALGRAIVRRPALYLMDEPLSNLDALLRVQTRTELIRMHQEMGTTTVYVTHDQLEAMTMGSRIAVMNKGCLQQVGTPQEIYGHPANVFVAGFFGSPPMNFLRGRIDLSKPGPSLATKAGRIGLPKSLGMPRESIEGREVILGARPESVLLGDRAIVAADAEWLFSTRIDVIEQLGHEAIVYVSLGEQAIAVRATDTEGLAVGMSVPACLTGNGLHIFDADGGTLI